MPRLYEYIGMFCVISKSVNNTSWYCFCTTTKFIVTVSMLFNHECIILQGKVYRFYNIIIFTTNYPVLLVEPITVSVDEMSV